MANEISIVVKGNSQDAQRAIDSTTKAQKQLGEQARQTGRDLIMEAAAGKVLDRQIDDLKSNMRRLAVDIANVSDESEKVKLTEKFKVDQSAHAELTRLRKTLSDIGDDSGRSFLASLRESLGGLPSELKGTAIAAAVAAGVAAAPFIGAAVGGAVLGGVGVGGIIGGVALAAQDPAVKAAGVQLRDNLLGDLRQAAQPFVVPLLSSFDELRSAEKSLTGELATGFAKIAPLVERVADDIEKAADALGPGLGDAFDKAGPVIKALADELPELAAAASEALSSISEESDGATLGLIELIHIVEYGIGVFGDLVSGLSATYEWLVRTDDQFAKWAEDWFGWLPVAGDAISAFHDETSSMIEGLGKSKEPIGGLARGFYEVAHSAEDAKAAADALNKSFNDLFGIQMSLDEANIRYQESIDKTLETLKDGKRTLDINSEAGRENKDAVLDQVKAISDLRDANIANGVSVDKANATYEAQLGQLEKTLLKLGFNKDEVKKLIQAYKDVPKNVSTEVEATGLATILAQLREIDRLFRQTAGYHDYRQGEISGHAFGGAVSSAQTGGARSGLTRINEMGPELARLPDGSIVIPSGQSVQMMQALASSGGQEQATAPQAPSGNMIGYSEQSMARAFRQALAGMPVVLNGQIVGQFGERADLLVRGG